MNRLAVFSGRIAVLALLAVAAFTTSSRLVANRNATAAEPQPVAEGPKDRLDQVPPQIAGALGTSPQGPTSHYGVRKLRAVMTSESLAVGASALVEVDGTIPETLFWVVRLLPEDAMQPGSHLDEIEPLAERSYIETPASPDHEFADLIPIEPPLGPGTYAVQVALETIDGRRAAAAMRRCTID